MFICLAHHRELIALIREQTSEECFTCPLSKSREHFPSRKLLTHASIYQIGDHLFAFHVYRIQGGGLLLENLNIVLDCSGIWKSNTKRILIVMMSRRIAICGFLLYVTL